MTSVIAARIIKPGPQTLWVDQGRRLCQEFGLAEGGAADLYAFRWVNQLLRNRQNHPALEINAGPFELCFETALRVALSGADCQATLNSQALHPWSSFTVQPGDRLKLGFARQGLRAYLGFKGEPQLIRHFGSYQPLNADGSAQILEADTPLQVSAAPVTRELHTMAPWWLIPDYQEILTLRLYPCYQFQGFTPEQRDKFFNGEYTIAPQSNRMGYRLQGEAVRWENAGIHSEGIAYGSVQVPPDGQPIVLLNDRQTIGGYPKIGCVARPDCYQLAQRRAGQRVKFTLANLTEP